MTIKSALLGHPLKNEDIKTEKLSRLWGLPIMASDAVSSVAYAIEEILIVLVPVLGFAAFGYVPYVVVAILLLLTILAFSYSQIIRHYPNGGGAYNVSKENLGRMPSLIAAAALVVDYVMTVAVSVSAATMAITAAAPELFHYRVELSVGFVLLITLGNLRGIRESSVVFGIPTYAFIVSMGVMILTGLIRLATGHLAPIAYTPDQLAALPQQLYQGLVILLVLRAFASGCSALTGVEAVSNAVPSFRVPSQRNARHVLFLLAGVIILIFGGTAILALSLHVISIGGTTVTAQIAQSVFGRTLMYFVIQATTALILILAANTAYNGLPLLLYILAHDSFVPRQFSHRGAKLSFSNGILFILVAASALIIAFKSDPHNLIPLYSVGVFISFTLSQYGMFRKWRRDKEKGWKYKSLINLLGAVVTGVGTIVVFSSKFLEGAWMLAIVMPFLILLMLYVRNHYDMVEKQLELKEFAPYYKCSAGKRGKPGAPVVVLLQSINKAALKAINYANSISNNVTVLHVCRYPDHARELREQWTALGNPLKLEIIENPYRDITKPLSAYVLEREKTLEHGQNLTVILIKYVTSHWYDLILHNQTTYYLERALSHFRSVTSVLVPYHYSIDKTVVRDIELDD